MLVQARDKNTVGGTHAIRLTGMRVFLPLLLILAVVLLLGVPARSACADDASGTKGSIKISTQDGKTHQYAAYKLLSGSVSNGKITSASLDGCVSAEAYKEAGATPADIESAQALIGWLSNKVAQDKDGVFTQKLANAVIKTEKDLSHDPPVTFSTGDAAAMDQGYWLIIPNEAQNDAQYKPQPMLVPIEGGKVLEVTEKKTVPVSTKQVQRAGSGDSWGLSTSAGEGDTLDFRVSTTLPSNLKAFKKYTLWLYDKLYDGLEFVEGSVKTYVARPRYRTVTGSLMALTAQADQTMEQVNLDVELLEDGRTLKMGSADILAAIPGLQPTDTLVVVYSCTLGEGATFGFDNANESVLSMQYTSSPTNEELTESTVTVQTKVYSFQLDLRKIGENNAPLAEASFIIQNADGEYRSASNTWSTNKSDAYVAVTDSKEGKALFEGLGEGTYTLTETKAPSGYKLLANPIKVSLTIPSGDAESHTLTATVTGGDATVISVNATSGMATVQVKNKKTGSNGGGSNGNNSNGGSNNSNSGSNNESNNNSNNGSDDNSNDNSNNNGSNSSSNNGSNTGSNNTGGSSSSSKASGTGNSATSVISNALRSVLPATGDPLFMMGGGTLVVSIGLIIWGKRRRSLQDDEGGER